MRKFMIAAAMMATTAGLAATPVNAEEFRASKVITEFNEDILFAVLRQMGATWEPAKNDFGDYLITFPNGLRATARFTACSSSTGVCKGTSISARFGKPSGMSEDEIRQRTINFNAKWSAGKSYQMQDGRPVVQAYMIVDGGITMENYRVQLAVYSDMLKKMNDELYGN
ncbi:MAG: YbjN domain-containing protein [Sphingomonadaceae bacterium]|nr:YbjN domain-containing protein [Sphingomonadaceae bacterium]